MPEDLFEGDETYIFYKWEDRPHTFLLSRTPDDPNCRTEPINDNTLDIPNPVIYYPQGDIAIKASMIRSNDSFLKKLAVMVPVHKVESYLSYHFSWYTLDKKGDPALFIKQTADIILYARRTKTYSPGDPYQFDMALRWLEEKQKQRVIESIPDSNIPSSSKGKCQATQQEMVLYAALMKNSPFYPTDISNKDMAKLVSSQTHYSFNTLYQDLCSLSNSNLEITDAAKTRVKRYFKALADAVDAIPAKAPDKE